MFSNPSLGAVPAAALCLPAGPSSCRTCCWLDEPTEPPRPFAWLEHFLEATRGMVVAVTVRFRCNFPGQRCQLDPRTPSQLCVPVEGNYSGWSIRSKSVSRSKRSPKVTSSSGTLARELDGIPDVAARAPGEGKARLSVYQQLLNQDQVENIVMFVDSHSARPAVVATLSSRCAIPRQRATATGC